MKYLQRISARLSNEITSLNHSKHTGGTIRSSSTNTDDFEVEMLTTADERERFYSVGADSFQHGTVAKRFIQAPEKRQPFLKAYFQHLFEGKLIDGTALLASLNKREIVDGREQAKTILYGVYIFDTRKSSESDISALLDIDKDATQMYTRRDEWKEKHIHTPIRQMAEEIGSAAWYLSHRMTVQEYKGQKMNLDHIMKPTYAAYEHGIKKYAGTPFKIPPFNYAFNSDTFPAALRGLDRLGFEMVGHCHYHYKPGLGCYLDNQAENTKENSCNLLYVEKKIDALIKEKLKQCITVG